MVAMVAWKMVWKFFYLSPKDLAALPALSFNHDCGLCLPPSGVVMANAAEGDPWSENVPAKRAE